MVWCGAEGLVFQRCWWLPAWLALELASHEVRCGGIRAGRARPRPPWVRCGIACLRSVRRGRRGRGRGSGGWRCRGWWGRGFRFAARRRRCALGEAVRGRRVGEVFVGGGARGVCPEVRGIYGYDFEGLYGGGGWGGWVRGVVSDGFRWLKGGGGGHGKMGGGLRVRWGGGRWGRRGGIRVALVCAWRVGVQGCAKCCWTAAGGGA